MKRDLIHESRMMGKDGTESLAAHDAMRNDDYSHNRRQTEYNQVYLNCCGAKEEKNLLNDTNGHKYSSAKNDLKELHESCRWLCATGWRGDITITVNGELMPCRGKRTQPGVTPWGKEKGERLKGMRPAGAKD